MLKKKALMLLSKEEIIDIILKVNDRSLNRDLSVKINDYVYKKINSILDKQEKTDCFSKEYEQLEEQYKKWVKIQESI